MYKDRWIAHVLRSEKSLRVIGAAFAYIPYIDEDGKLTATDDEILSRMEGCPQRLRALLAMARSTPYLDGSQAVITHN
jgi:hypothetical protein